MDLSEDDLDLHNTRYSINLESSSYLQLLKLSSPLSILACHPSISIPKNSLEALDHPG